MSNGLNKHCSVHSSAGFEVKRAKDIVRECLIPFPFIWASVNRVLNLWYMPHDA